VFRGKEARTAIAREGTGEEFKQKRVETKAATKVFL
jgi:hypothetical protein